MRDTDSVLSGVDAPRQETRRGHGEYCLEQGSPIPDQIKEAGRDSCSGKRTKKADVCATYERDRRS
jgi:hypothetical protein